MSAANPDHLDCAYCSYVGPPPPEVAASLREAAAVLGGLEARRRQLTGFQHRTLERMGCSMVLYFALLAAVALPFAVSAAVCTAVRDTMPTAILLVIGFGPLAMVLASGAFGFWWMRRSRAALELACAAQPPAARGRPACCRVCGGELMPRSGSAVVRCGFCGADNVVSEAAMQRRWSEQQVVLGGYEQAVRMRALAAGSTSLYASLLVLVAAVGAPIVAGALGLVVGFVLVVQERPPDTSEQYVAVATPRGRCLALLEHYPGGIAAYDFGTDAPPDVARKRARLPKGTYKPISVPGLVGLTLIDEDGLARPVRRVYRTKLDDKENYVEFAPRKGHLYKPTQSVIGSCLAGDKPPRRVLGFDDIGDPLLVARTGHELVIGFSDGLYGVSGKGALHRIWKNPGAAGALGMLADADAVYVDLPEQLLRIAPVGKVDVLARTPAHDNCRTALDGHMLYFADPDGVARVACAGGKVEQVLKGVVAKTLGASGGAVAWIDARGDVAARAADGDKPVVLGHGAMLAHGVAIAQSRVFWVTGDGTLVSAPVAGGALERHGKLDGIHGAFAIRQDDAWWARRGEESSALLSRALAGGALTDHSPHAKSVSAFGFDGSDVYWLDSSRDWLMQRPL